MSEDIKEQPLVSIIIPTYGRQDMLEEACRSALDQTWNNIELIVVDDNSPQSVDLSMFDDHRLVIRRHFRNMGPGASKNTGLAVAKGSFVLFLDDDDLLTKQRIEIGLRDIGDAYMHATPSNIDNRCFSGDLTSSFNSFSPPSILQVLFKKEHILQFDPTLRVAEDIDWWIRMSDRAIFAWTNEVGLIIRTHDSVRPGVDSNVRFQCREFVLRRHLRGLNRPGKWRQYWRTSAAAIEARRPIKAVKYATLGFWSEPGLLSIKLLVHAIILIPKIFFGRLKFPVGKSSPS